MYHPSPFLMLNDLTSQCLIHSLPEFSIWNGFRPSHSLLWIFCRHLLTNVCSFRRHTFQVLQVYRRTKKKHLENAKPGSSPDFLCFPHWPELQLNIKDKVLQSGNPTCGNNSYSYKEKNMRIAECKMEEIAGRHI